MWFGVWCLGFRVEGAVWGLGFRVEVWFLLGIALERSFYNGLLGSVGSVRVYVRVEGSRIPRAVDSFFPIESLACSTERIRHRKAGGRCSREALCRRGPVMLCVQEP